MIRDGLLFSKRKAFLIEKIGKWLLGSVEHVGSTSVPGMVAKPIIDIMFGVDNLEALKGAIEILQRNGYCYYPYKPDVMHWFCKPSPEIRPHHLHLVPYKSPLWDERVKFRNILLEQSRVAMEYGALKPSLAAEMAYDREACTRKSGRLSKGYYMKTPTANKPNHADQFYFPSSLQTAWCFERYV